MDHFPITLWWSYPVSLLSIPYVYWKLFNPNICKLQGKSQLYSTWTYHRHLQLTYSKWGPMISSPKLLFLPSQLMQLHLSIFSGTTWASSLTPSLSLPQRLYQEILFVLTSQYLKFDHSLTIFTATILVWATTIFHWDCCFLTGLLASALAPLLFISNSQNYLVKNKIISFL